MPHWFAVGLTVLCAFMVCRGVAYGYLLWRSRKLLALMKAYWNDEGRYGDVGHKKREIVDLFRVARLVEPGVTIAEPAAGGVIQRASSVFDNLFMRRGDVQQLVFDAFLEATGYFRVEVRRSLLPVFWPSVIAKLPGDLLAYVGLRGRRVATAVRVADGVGWIVAVAAGLVTVWKAFG